MFWGIVIIVVGVLVLLNSIFGIDLPIFKILFGFFLIYWGIQVIFGGLSINSSFSLHNRSNEHEAIFAKSIFTYPLANQDDDKEYITVFGQSELDLTSLVEFPSESLEMVTVFGKTKLIVKKGIPLEIKSQTVFGASLLPDGNKNAFGDFNYRSSAVKEGAQSLKVNSQVIFGRFEVIERD